MCRYDDGCGTRAGRRDCDVVEDACAAGRLDDGLEPYSFTEAWTGLGMLRPDAAASAIRCARPSEGLAGSPDAVLEDDMMM